YAFVIDTEVLYVGKTVDTLRKRMYGYQKPGPTQSTNIRNNKNLIACLASGKVVSIFVLPDHGLLKYGGFNLSLAAGLEDSIVSALKPKWNKTGT
ncbi:MAG TPA: GIY-YIG nuclease family protein, partial [Nitrospira sp.]|nr:GIY-YIG nuclease family protein [Nitrospira sp.]